MPVAENSLYRAASAVTRPLADPSRATFSLRFIPESIHTAIRVERRSGS
ncbi:MAG: hypothetical protein HY812_02245 [Planctomycetes bacterium]|nr:hypothetical protein [Planctomycetota bacterium]